MRKDFLQRQRVHTTSRRISNALKIVKLNRRQSDGAFEWLFNASLGMLRIDSVMNEKGLRMLFGHRGTTLT
ncbi:hypothetical protein LSH36_795g00012 [Paralvinella palmiformis]|uniref:Uncharacterized protein n=1 Tax=Paralvinella palmiformis TaxID=53620 RepID=A0AAD9J0D7_9ANNE|nr:hypothetical protein LSH36_795g00012 [Paralvinella palmiformis]